MHHSDTFSMLITEEHTRRDLKDKIIKMSVRDGYTALWETQMSAVPSVLYSRSLWDQLFTHRTSEEISKKWVQKNQEKEDHKNVCERWFYSAVWDTNVSCPISAVKPFSLRPILHFKKSAIVEIQKCLRAVFLFSPDQYTVKIKRNLEEMGSEESRERRS